MIHTIACNTQDCPYRRNKPLGCAHPEGVGKVSTRKSLEGAVPRNCPVQHKPAILVAPPPAAGLLAPVAYAESCAARAMAEVHVWLETAHTVFSGRA
jgi:hypothetical protein